MRIVEGHRGRRPLGRRLLSTLAAAIGTALVLAGLVASVFPILFVVAVGLATLEGDPVDLPAEDVPFLLVTVLLSVAGIPLGIRLVRGKRRLVLFLRKFGHVEATDALSSAVQRATGRAFRLVTLDDRAVTPVGTAPGPRRVARLGLVVALGLGLWLAVWLLGGGPEAVVEGVDIDASSGSDGFAEAIGRAIVTALAAGLVAGVLLALALLAVGILGIGALFSFGGLRAARGAERAQRVVVREADDILPAARGIADRSRRIFGPRLAVVEVDDAVWREVVRELASAAGTVVVDVSHPSEHVLWELETLRASHGTRWVLVGERERLQLLARSDGNEGPVVSAMVRLLADDDVLAYRNEATSLRRFARSLRVLLDRSTA